MGVAKWIDEQLHPESIHDSALEARLSRFPTLSMSSEALLQKFPPPQVAAKREGITPQEYRKEQQAKAAGRTAGQGRTGPAGADGDDRRESGSERRLVRRAEATSRRKLLHRKLLHRQTMAPDELAEILLPGAKNGKGQNGPGNPDDELRSRFKRRSA